MTSLLILYGGTAVAAAGLASVSEGADFTSSIVAIGAPAAAGSYISSELLGIPYKKDAMGLAWFVGTSGAVAVGLLAVTGQVEVALDSPTLMLVALTGGSAAIGSYLAAKFA